MKMNFTKKTKAVLLIAVVSLTFAGLGAVAVHQSPASASSSQSIGKEAADAETNDDAKGQTVQTSHVQDNGQDGETADASNQ